MSAHSIMLEVSDLGRAPAWKSYHRTTAWQAFCSCGWQGAVHRNEDWKHPDVRAGDDAEQHLRHECPTCTAINQGTSPKATRYMGRPPGTHPLHDDPRFRCPLHDRLIPLSKFPRRHVPWVEQTMLA